MVPIKLRKEKEKTILKFQEGAMFITDNMVIQKPFNHTILICTKDRTFFQKKIEHYLKIYHDLQTCKDRL